MDGNMDYGMILDIPAWVSRSPQGAKASNINSYQEAVDGTKINVLHTVFEDFLNLNKKTNNEIINLIADIKDPLKNNKDLFQLYKIQEDISHINNKEFLQGDDIDYLRELLMFEDLTGNPSKVDNKKYLDRLLLN